VDNFSKEFLDRHSELKGKIDGLRRQNEAYLTLTELQDERRRADDTLKRAIEDILEDIEREINGKMKAFNDSLFSASRKAPHIRYRGYNSYEFETPDDTGTGSNYKGMVIYDLDILYLTAGDCTRFADSQKHRGQCRRRYYEAVCGKQETGVYRV
jgi:hypothetical protein